MVATKINLTKKHAHINVNVVRGHSYETKICHTKFHSTKISRSMELLDSNNQH